MTASDRRPVRLLALIEVPVPAREALGDAFVIDEAQRDAAGAWLLPGDGADYRGIVTGYRGTVDAALLDRLPSLGLIACFTAGRDMVDVAEAAARGIPVVSNNAALADSVADHGMAMLLGLARDIPGCDAHVRSGAWVAGRMGPGRLLKGRKLGIAGYGGIGQGIARRAAAFGMEIGVFTRRDPGVAGQSYFAEIGALAAWSDWLALALPGVPETNGIVDAQVLEALGPDGYLVNVGRGSLVDEPALIAALKGGTIAGAALDVFASEPAPDPALVACPNLMLSPHQASNTAEAMRIRSDAFAEILTAHFFGD